MHLHIQPVDETKHLSPVVRAPWYIQCTCSAATTGVVCCVYTALYCGTYDIPHQNMVGSTDNTLFGTVNTITCLTGHFFPDDTNVKTTECAETVGSNYIDWTLRAADLEECAGEPGSISRDLEECAGEPGSISRDVYLQ